MKQKSPELSEGDRLLTEALKWVDRIYIKVLEAKRQDFLKRAGQYLYKKRNSDG